MEEKKLASHPSLEPQGDAVKNPDSLGNLSHAGRGWRRHLEGWELGAGLVLFVLVITLLAVPRAAVPRLFPVPLITPREEAAVSRELKALADSVRTRPLPFETRAVGEAFRQLGREFALELSARERALSNLHERVTAARGLGQEKELLRLRALQTQLFVQAVHAYVADGKESAELRELGGDFVARSTENAWLAPGRLAANDATLSTLFALRWTQLVGLRKVTGFAPSLGELRRYYRFLLLFPEHGSKAEPTEVARRRLRYATALAEVDPSYPVELARGVLSFQAGLIGPSQTALAAHLARGADSEWALLARNYLVAVRGEGEASEAVGDF